MVWLADERDIPRIQQIQQAWLATGARQRTVSWTEIDAGVLDAPGQSTEIVASSGLGRGGRPATLGCTEMS